MHFEIFYSDLEVNVNCFFIKFIRKTGSYNFIKKDVLMTHLLRFEQALTNTIQKLSGGISLDVPPALVEGLKQDKELKETFMASLLENTCNGWLGQVGDFKISIIVSSRTK